MSDPFGPEAFAAATGVSRETLARLESFAGLLERWQAKINLVGPKTLETLWSRHMLDSAQLLPLAGAEARIWTDLGSGGGFPGLVLAILLADRAGARVHLVESHARKCAFLAEAARICEAPAEIHRGRIEALDPWPSDVVTARALTALPALLDLAVPFLAPGGVLLFPKGADWARELTEARKSWTVEADAQPSRTEGAGRILRLRNPLPAPGPESARRRRKFE